MKRAFGRIGLLCKDNDKSRAVGSRVAAYLDSKVLRGTLLGYLVEASTAKMVACKTRPGKFSPSSPKADCIIVVGGDGALLKSERDYPGVPKLLVNTGNVGFLSQLNEDFEKGLDLFLAGRFRVAEFPKMAVKIAGRTHEALNDAYAFGAKPWRPVNFRVSSGFFDEIFYANGIVFATPTGSTAHSFSAGGPIVSPQLECLVATPVAPLNPLLRSIVFSAGEAICLEPIERKALLSVDGFEGLPFSHAEISLSKSRARFVEVLEQDFMKRLRRKLFY
ncbi:MAG: NAD(+)/NADH kinase [Candidatus Micrarchaeota archaeon]